MKASRIRWTTHTWNPVTGCTEVSPGCDNCYAKRIAEPKRGHPSFPNGFDVTLRPHKMNTPISWKEPAMVFVNSMSDLFHRSIPDAYLRQVWTTMLTADRHVYQVLTKRPHRMVHLIETLHLPTPPHIWLGTSVESQAMADSRIPALLATPAPIRFVSAEPLLGPVDLGPWIADLQWIIVGGESGPGRRAMDYEWARAIRDVCAGAGVPFFYKQGNHALPDRDVDLDGRTHEQFPGRPGDQQGRLL